MTIILRWPFISCDRRTIDCWLSCTTLIPISHLESCIKQTQRFITRRSHRIHPSPTWSRKPNSLARSPLTSWTCVPSHSCSPQWPCPLDRIYWGYTQCIKVLTLITRRRSFFVFYTPLERCRASSSTTLQSYYLEYEDLDVQHVLHIGLSSA